MAGLCRELPKKPVETDVRRILIAHAMLDKSGVRNGHKILRGFTAGPTEGKGVFADCPLGFKPNITKYNRITHKGPPFPSYSQVETVADVNLQ